MRPSVQVAVIQNNHRPHLHPVGSCWQQGFAAQRQQPQCHCSCLLAHEPKLTAQAGGCVGSPFAIGQHACQSDAARVHFEGLQVQARVDALAEKSHNMVDHCSETGLRCRPGGTSHQIGHAERLLT